MGEESLASWTGERHAYPRDLAPFVRERWAEVSPASPLPELPVLEGILSTSYQVSLLREEERPITFRLILAGPERFPPEDGPPSGLHRLEFPEARPFGVEELRRLSPAADLERSLVGVRPDGEWGPEIWGLVHSGSQRLGDVEGGRGASRPLPPAPVVRVAGPGHVEVCEGSVTVARLAEGRLSGSFESVYDSAWLRAAFAPIRAELMELHLAAREKAEEPWAELDVEVTRKIAQRMVRRLISAVRESRHGGTVLMVPPDLTGELSGENRYVELKYRFTESEPRRRFRTLIVGLMNALAAIHGRRGAKSVGWNEYETCRDEALMDLEEAIFEFSHLVAGLAAVDGAVVLTKRYELLGFGGEISGELPNVRTVARALDVEGDRIVEEPAEGVGTRHRSAYRLASALPEALAVVVSQDGSARLVKQQDGTVTYWDQA